MERDINQMNLNELEVLESSLDICVHNILSQKVIVSMVFSIRIKTLSWLSHLFNKFPLCIEQMQIMSRDIYMLRNKVGF
jgi:hypothetical protein